MSDRFRGNTTGGRVAMHKILVFISLGLVAVFILSCGGSSGKDDDAGAETEEATYAPVVFMADKDTNGITELYASFDDGTDIIKLSGNMVSGGNVVEFKVSPNGIWAAYVADQDRISLFELYVVPVDKASNRSAVKVSVPLAGIGLNERFPGSGDYLFAWAPDSSRVAYIADAADPPGEIANLFELFTSTPDGKEKDLISDIVDFASDVRDFQWEPLSTLIAYVADQDRVGELALYVAPSDGSDPSVRVSALVTGANGIKEEPAGSGEYAFAWAPDSFRIAYIADQFVPDKFELFTSTPDGTSNLLISGPSGINRDVEKFKWAPNNDRIAYTANQNLIDAIDLYSASPDNSFLVQQLSTGLFSGGEVSAFKWAPDSSLIAFLADKDSPGIFRLYTVPPFNNQDLEVSGGLTLSTSDVTEFEWALDSSRIAYLVDAQGFELYTTRPAEGPSTPITGDRVTIRDVFDFEWAPDSSRIAYTADHDVGGVIELFSSTPDNNDTDQVSGSLVTGGDVGAFKWAPDSSGVGYIANQDASNLDELYASRPNGSDNTLLSDAPLDEDGDPVFSGDVSDFEWVP